ncbi:hypothetical protein HDU67_006424 [Dinochytrium kinnereticum]|nr:hypothetical protein HDU67_006424 [Dinochytrium kinnereticum]
MADRKFDEAAIKAFKRRKNQFQRSSDMLSVHEGSPSLLDQQHPAHLVPPTPPRSQSELDFYAAAAQHSMHPSLLSMDPSMHYPGFASPAQMYSLLAGSPGMDHLAVPHHQLPYPAHLMHPYGMALHHPSQHSAAAQQALEVQARIIFQQQQQIAHMNALAAMGTPSGSPSQSTISAVAPTTPSTRHSMHQPQQRKAPTPAPHSQSKKVASTKAPRKRKAQEEEIPVESEDKPSMTDDGQPKPHAIPATIPLVEVKDGVEWITFSYTIKGVRQQFHIRTDIDNIAFDEISEEFKFQNCVYPKANCEKQDYKGNRWDYESSVNLLGWKLSYLNESEIGGRRGLIQRAVDSFRNRFPELRSRRVLRQEKYVNGTLRKRNDKVEDPANDMDENELLNEARRTNENSEWSEILSLLARRQKSPKSITFEGIAEGRLYKTRIRVDVDLVDSSAVDTEFKEANCIYPRALGTFEAFLQSLHAAYLPPFHDPDNPVAPFPSSLDPFEADNTSLRYNQEAFCNEIAWRLAHINPKLAGKRFLLQKALDAYRARFCDMQDTELDGTFLAKVAIHPRRGRRAVRALVRSISPSDVDE